MKINPLSAIAFYKADHRKQLIILSDRQNRFTSSFSSDNLGFLSNESLIELKDYELTEVQA